MYIAVTTCTACVVACAGTVRNAVRIETRVKRNIETRLLYTYAVCNQHDCIHIAVSIITLIIFIISSHYKIDDPIMVMTSQLCTSHVRTYIHVHVYTALYGDPRGRNANGRSFKMWVRLCFCATTYIYIVTPSVDNVLHLYIVTLVLLDYIRYSIYNYSKRQQSHV